MAFFSVSDLQVDLPGDFDSSLASRLLVRLEADLNQLNLVFTAPAPTTRSLTTGGFTQTLFDFGSATDLTSVTLKDYQSYSQVLVLGTDYILTEHPNISGYYTRLQLIESLARQVTCYPRGNYLLGVTAKWGLYIDITSTTNFGSKLLKSIVVDFLAKQLSYANQGYQTIKRASTGSSNVEFEPDMARSYSSSILSDNEYTSQLDYFLC